MRLRPSMREDYRYMLAMITPSFQGDAKEVYHAVHEAFQCLYGDILGARAWIAVMEYSNPWVIFRYRRGEDNRVETALACTGSIAGVPVAIHTVRRSGTIRTLREIIKRKGVECTRSVTIRMNEEMLQAVVIPPGRINLKGKGINLQIPLYITEEDIEDLYYDE
jgi:ribonuclease P/MRP protein subunit POP5